MNLQGRFVIDRSANHIHLREADALKLFGEDCFRPNLTLKPLAIVGEFATNLKVIAGNGLDEPYKQYTVLYPFRSYSQLELAASDYYKLFKSYPKRVASGNLEGASVLNVRGSVEQETGVNVPVIVSEAHIHIANTSDLFLLNKLNFPFPFHTKTNETTDGKSHIHLDVDQYAAIMGL